MSNQARVKARARPANRRETTLNLMCSTCRHRWQDQIFQPINPTQFKTKFSAMLCPNCGIDWKSHRVSMPQTYGLTVPLRDLGLVGHKGSVSTDKDCPPPPE